ncbi:MAG: hypothetical protein BalsKO_24250 [Balneolaceae bacterium]
MVEFYKNHPECFKEAIEMALTKEEPFCWRAAWMIGGDIKKNDQRFNPYISKILRYLPEFEDGHQRELLKILLQISLTEEQESLLFDLSVNLWEQVRKKPSVRHFAFRGMMKVADKYPELKHEILVLAQPLYINPLSPGIRQSVIKAVNKLED